MANLQKTILGKKIKGFEFYKQLDYRFNRMRVHGFVRLEGGEMVHVRFNEFKIINELGQVSGIVLESNPGYKQIKRMIARRFQSYRKGGKSFFRERVSTLRTSVNNGLHNVRLFKISGISFSENRSNFLRLAS